MLEVNDVFADFQLVKHKIKKIKFEYPSKKINCDKLKYKIDFEVAHLNDNQKTFYGIVKFFTCVCKSDECFLESEIEGVFVGNKAVHDFNSFHKMLKFNGVATLSQISRLAIMNITSNAGFDKAIVIPMINVIELNREKDKE